MMGPQMKSTMLSGAGPRADQWALRARDRGFTMVEMMVVAAVIAILAAIALPIYSEQVIKARRVEARTAVLDLATRQERYYSINNAYTDNAALLGYGAAATFPVSVGSGSVSYYTLTVPSVTAGTATALPTYVARATPSGAQQADTKCYTYQINQLGAKSNLNSGGTAMTTTDCW